MSADFRMLKSDWHDSPWRARFRKSGQSAEGPLMLIALVWVAHVEYGTTTLGCLQCFNARRLATSQTHCYNTQYISDVWGSDSRRPIHIHTRDIAYAARLGWYPSYEFSFSWELSVHQDAFFSGLRNRKITIVNTDWKALIRTNISSSGRDSTHADGQ